MMEGEDVITDVGFMKDQVQMAEDIFVVHTMKDQVQVAEKIISAEDADVRFVKNQVKEGDV